MRRAAGIIGGAIVGGLSCSFAVAWSGVALEVVRWITS